MFKLIEVETKIQNQDIKNIERYENSNYKLHIFYYNYDYISLHIVKKDVQNRFIPTIYLKSNNDDYIINAIEIETTAYGSLQPKDIEKIIEGYKIAVKASGELKELLVNLNLFKGGF